MPTLNYAQDGKWNELKFEAHITNGLPIGSIICFGGNTIPLGWKLCDGSALRRDFYPGLFNAIGTIYGEGDGSTTFNLPNFKGKVPVGTNRDDSDFRIVGQTGGAKSKPVRALIGATHGNIGRIGYAAAGKVTDAAYTYSVEGSNTIANVPAGNINHSTLVFNEDGKDPSLLQPYLTVNYIIKVQETNSGVIAAVEDTMDSYHSNNALSANMGRCLKDKIEGVMLYENTAGSDEDITLNHYLYNFKRLKVEYYVEHGGKQRFVKEFFNPSGQIATLGFVIKDATQDVLFVGGKTVELADNYIRNLAAGRANQASMEFNTFQQWTVSQISIMITRVIAYYDY